MIEATAGVFIAGEWVATDQYVTNINPSDTTDTVGRFGVAGSHHVDQAVAAAAAGQRQWRATPIEARSNFLHAIADEVDRRSDALGYLLAREEGKTLAEAVGEARRTASIFRFFAGEAMRISGEIIESTRPGVDVLITREALGVVGVITPWNYPLAIPAWKIAPALAYGNSVIWKPATLVPASAVALTNIIHEAGVPDGLVNLLVGSGGSVGQAIVAHDGVEGVSFTGSVEVGASVARTTSGRLARVQLEMGGKNALVVLDDADIDRAVDVAAQGSFLSTGQRCTASSRLLIESGIYQEFVDRLVEAARALKVGNALAAETQIGPAVSAQQLEQDLAYVEIGRNEGAELLVGGVAAESDKPGHYISPAVLASATNDMRISREEIFGPVVAVMPVEGLDEALAVTNDCDFGLTAGICTSSLAAATRFRREAEVGMVMVNLPTAGVDAHVPFGGRKSSNLGPREQGRSAIEFYTQLKTSYVSP